MPERDAKLLDIRTSPIGERIGAIDDFVATGYEMRLDFSPVVLREGWQRDWARLAPAGRGRAEHCGFPTNGTFGQ